MPREGVCTDQSSTIISWANTPGASFTNNYPTSQDDYRAKIVEEIDADRPVMVYYGTHWVLAYGYTYGGTSNSNISVWDPWNSNETATNGVDQALSVSMSTQGTPNANMTRLMITAKK